MDNNSSETMVSLLSDGMVLQTMASRSMKIGDFLSNENCLPIVTF